jgi:hypothetical protein
LSSSNIRLPLLLLLLLLLGQKLGQEADENAPSLPRQKLWWGGREVGGGVGGGRKDGEGEVDNGWVCGVE